MDDLRAAGTVADSSLCISARVNSRLSSRSIAIPKTGRVRAFSRVSLSPVDPFLSLLYAVHAAHLLFKKETISSKVNSVSEFYFLIRDRREWMTDERRENEPLLGKVVIKKGINVDSRIARPATEVASHLGLSEDVQSRIKRKAQLFALRGRIDAILSLDDGVPLLDCRARGKERWRTRVSLDEEKRNNQTAEESRQRHVLLEEGREARAGNASARRRGKRPSDRHCPLLFLTPPLIHSPLPPGSPTVRCAA